MSNEKSYAPGRVPKQRPGKVGGKRAANRVERTRAICEAARPLFLQRGVETVTVDEITQAANVAKGSFYRYFDGKQQLVRSLFEPLVEEFLSAMQRCEGRLNAAASTAEVFSAYETLAGELALVLLQSPESVKLYLQECRAPSEGARVPIREFSEQVTQAAISLTEVAHQRKLLRTNLSARLTAITVVGATENLLFRFLDRNDLGEPHEVTGALVGMVLDGIRAEDPPAAHS